MEKKIWHRCQCSGQEFTQDEWFAYCQEHALGNEVACEYEGFIWNIHDVCLNPQTPVKVVFDGYFRFEVRIAKSKNGWAYGLDISCGTSGYGSGCHWALDNKPTEKEAIHQSLLQAKEFAQRSFEAYKKRKIRAGDDEAIKGLSPRYEKLLGEVERYLDYYDVRQLELF